MHVYKYSYNHNFWHDWNKIIIYKNYKIQNTKIRIYDYVKI